MSPDVDKALIQRNNFLRVYKPDNFSKYFFQIQIQNPNFQIQTIDVINWNISSGSGLNEMPEQFHWDKFLLIYFVIFILKFIWNLKHWNVSCCRNWRTRYNSSSRRSSRYNKESTYYKKILTQNAQIHPRRPSTRRPSTCHWNPAHEIWILQINLLNCDHFCFLSSQLVNFLVYLSVSYFCH